MFFLLPIIKFAPSNIIPATKMLKDKESLDALFQYATEGILITSGKGEIVKANPSAEKLFGYHSGELNGKSVDLLVPNKFAHTHSHHRETYYRHPHPRTMGIGMDLYGKRKDDSEFPVEISLSNYSIEEGIFVIAFIIDISVRKAAEEKLKNYSTDLEKQVQNRTMILQEAIEELEKTKEELRFSLQQEKELSDLKSRFVSMASHEFRTPLGTILSSAQLISKYEHDSGKRIKHINRIKSAVNTLTEILTDFLSIGKLEEGAVFANPEKFDIVELINEIIQEIQPLSKNGQNIIYNYSGKEKSVVLDKKFLKHVLFNLISNAIKFSPEGKNIDIASEVDNLGIEIKVKDKGIGIPDEDKEHLFERFFRANNATNIQGTGLGLNIVSKYVELMNGKIKCESKLNEGTTFTIEFPRQS